MRLSVSDEGVNLTQFLISKSQVYPENRSLLLEIEYTIMSPGLKRVPVLKNA
jgi:hypothetical protein